MHFSTFFLAATALCATSVSAGCFGHGQHWGDHDEAKGQLTAACTDLKGSYGTGTYHNVCKNKPSDPSLSYRFQIQFNGVGSKNISQSDCGDHIGGIIDTCGHGGDLTVGNVVYRGDPNQGSC